MKKCPQCNQIYDNDTNFCLSDGTTLVLDSGFTSPNVEIPTVIGNAPFVPPNYLPPRQAKSETPVFTYLAIGLLTLIIGGGIVGAAVYFLTKSDEKGNSNTNVSNENSKKDELADEKERLKAQQDKLDEEKKRLADERKDLENKKKQTPLPTVAPSVQNPSRTAYIIDPPSNIRAAPNGTVICVARTRGTVVNILGSTGISDNNGTWYYTDYCGRQGVIHSTQIRF